MEWMWRDIRQALRVMSEHKAFSAGVLLTLALGIGANTAMFSIVHGVLLRPLSYEEPAQLVRLFEEHPGGIPASWARTLLSDFTRDAWVPASRTIEETATFSNSFRFSIGRENPVRVPGAIVSPSLFRVLRVQPAVGRFFRDDDAMEGAGAVVVLGYGLWMDLYAATPAAIGQTLFLNERPHLIVGVAPQHFAFPDADAAFWLPERVATNVADPRARRIRMLRAIACGLASRPNRPLRKGRRPRAASPIPRTSIGYWAKVTLWRSASAHSSTRRRRTSVPPSFC